MKDHPPFITGSRAYGAPSETSDLDLVVLVEDEAIINVLRELNEKPGHGLCFGKLNLIAVDEEGYDRWREGTDSLIKRKEAGEVITRDIAIGVFKALRVKGYEAREDGEIARRDRRENTEPRNYDTL